MAKRRKPAAGRTRGTAQPRRILATLPDALGAQSVIVVAGTQTKPLLALLLIKPDAGIADANIIRCHDRNEAAAILQEYRPLAPHELSIAMGRTLLSAALGDGAPAPDWPEAACVTGLNDLEPTPLHGTDWASVLDPLGTRLDVSTLQGAAAALEAVKPARAWAARHPMIQTWEEEIACLQQANADPNDDPERLAAYVWPYVAGNRFLWMEVFLRAAAVLRDNHDDWYGLAQSGFALLRTAEVETLPIVQVIAQQTVQRFREEPGGSAAADDPGLLVGTSGVPAEPGELERLLGRAGAEADAMWLDGFMTGCELAPEPTSHEAWAQDLIRHGDIRQDRDAMHRLLDLALQRYETLLEALNEPDAIRDSVAAVSEADLCAWARGFTAATERMSGAWPAERLRPADRTWLDALAALARDGTPIADRPSLAAWLAKRAEITARPEA